MAKVVVSETYLSDIADAIRAKNGTANTYTPAQMAGAISAISGGSSPNLQAKTNISPIASNQTIQADSGYDGLSSVQINAVVLSNLLATNIKNGVTVKVGDASDDDCVASVTGTYNPVKTKTGTFTGDGTRQAAISCDFEPDLVYWTSDPGTSASSGTVAGIIVRGLLAANRYRNNSTTNSSNIMIDITGMNTGGSSYSFRATYESNTVTLYCFNSGSRSLFTNGRTYSYTFVKWT